MNKPIYPDVRIEILTGVMSMYTILRKLHEGEWYEWVIYDLYNLRYNPTHISELDPEYITECTTRFHSMVYHTQILGVVVPAPAEDTFLAQRIGAQEKCENQISETDRLMENKI